MTGMEVRSEEKWSDSEDMMSGGQETEDVGANSSGHGSIQVIQH